MLTSGIARSGCNVVIPYREEMAKRHLKVTGDLGRITFMVRAMAIIGKMCAHSGRNSTSETRTLSRRACDILTLYTI